MVVISHDDKLAVMPGGHAGSGLVRDTWGMVQKWPLAMI